MSKKVSVEAVAVMSDKTGVSDRVAATLASAVLEGSGLVNTDDLSLVVDRSRIRRARKRTRMEKTKQQNQEEPIESVYFDGRKDTTKVSEIIESKQYVKLAQEEHVTLVQEPDSHYIGHITPMTGSARNISCSILDFLQSNNYDVQNIIAIGCDETAVNTGQKGGIIKLLEDKLKKPLHWFVCLLHANELPLRHLIQNIDGQTSGPRSFTGPIGKCLHDCEKLPIAQFTAIPCEDISFESSDLSTDQAYLLQIHRAVSTGECSRELALKNPGKMHHARWLTTANRILRLYVSEANPTPSLLAIVNYIMAVYAPVWFSIKKQPSAIHGAQHLFALITKSRSMTEEHRTIVEKVIQNNAYFAHPENLLLAMIYDESAIIRELGLRRILKARECAEETIPRTFKLPKLIFSATSYYSMINWQTIQVTEPPATKKLSTEDIITLVNTKELPKLIPDFPCHTQAVERLIKLVTEASTSVVGNEARDGYIRNKIEGRKKLPKFETKKQYRLN